MIRFEPTLIIQRLVVERGGKAVYDEQFHSGVNVIRGENSSGKSTVLNFLFYALGGDLTDWSEVARLCERVLIQVSLNGKTATLSREISTQHGQPMSIYGGTIDEAKSASLDAWIQYPYKRSANKESYSQALFRLLGIPEVSNETTGNLTIHQILRLLYADQLSPVETLFKFESVFDPPMLRESVGRLLCGAYDQGIYENEIKIKSLQREFDSIAGELSSLFSVIGAEPLNRNWLDAQRAKIKEEQKELIQKIELAEQRVFTSSADDELTLSAQADVYADVQRLQAELVKSQQERDSLALNIADSAAFISALEMKVNALNDSSSVASVIDEVRFQCCPSCYAPLEEVSEHACHLCKSPFDAERSRSRIVALINDTAIQLKQSRALQENRLKKTAFIEKEISRLNGEWHAASRRLAALQRLPSSEAREHLRMLHRQAGYLDRQSEDLENKAELVEIIEERTKQKERLNGEIAKLKAANGTMRESQEQRLRRAHTAISDEIRTLLKNDLRRQDSFENPNVIDFDFASNRISVDGQTYFSASSRVILKSSFFVGFLAAATKNQFFRHPRFCLIDTIEDKGMEPQRSHNFQMEIARVSAEAKVEHQIIFATAMIAPALDDEKYLIGDFSTRDEPTIDIQI